MASSSDNQGLQIAVIIFALLTIIMSGATFYVFKLSEDAELRLAAANQSAQEANAGLRAALDEIDAYKKMAGPKYATAKIDEAQKLYDADMAAYASTFPEESRSYSGAIQYLIDTLKEQQAERVKEAEELAQLKVTIEEMRTNQTKQLAKHETETKTALDETRTVTAKFTEDRNTLNEEKKNLAVDKQKLQDQINDLNQKFAADAQKAQQEIHKLELLNDQKQEVLTALQQETFEVADGEIRWISPQTRSAWINLGRGDGLRKGVTFGVFGIDENGVARGQSKAKVEVTQILGDHLAEARIVEDVDSDPIIIGDKLYTPLWHPGRVEHFALAGHIDLDQDTISDVAFLRDLITQSGAVLDAELLPDGKMQGEMTVNTRYLIRGEPGQGQEEPLGEMIAKADKLGIQSISIAEFLDHMGWKDSSKVVQFGSNADPKDFQYNPNQNRAQRAAPSSVGQFRRRTPPRSTGNTAYGRAGQGR